jgi:hypothetical protein
LLIRIHRARRTVVRSSSSRKPRAIGRRKAPTR